MSNDDAQKRGRVRLLPRDILNPPTIATARLGLLLGHVLLETVGRRTGKRRDTVVGMHLDGPTAWVVAEQGRHAGDVRNIETNPMVRVCLRGRWRSAHARVVPDDDPQARLDGFGRRTHASNVRRFGTDLLTLRFDFTGAGGRGASSTDASTT